MIRFFFSFFWREKFSLHSISFTLTSIYLFPRTVPLIMKFYPYVLLIIFFLSFPFAFLTVCVRFHASRTERMFYGSLWWQSRWKDWDTWGKFILKIHLIVIIVFKILLLKKIDFFSLVIISCNRYLWIISMDKGSIDIYFLF